MQDEEKNETASAAGEQSTGADSVAATSEAPRNPNMKWYIIHSYSGFERKVKESLESRVAAFGLQEKIGKDRHKLIERAPVPARSSGRDLLAEMNRSPQVQPSSPAKRGY